MYYFEAASNNTICLISVSPSKTSKTKESGTATCQTWYRSAQSHKHHSSDRVFEANGAAKVRRQVTNHRCQEADDHDGDDKAGPTIPVVGRRNKSKQKLPEDGEEMHEIVKTGGQLLLVIIIVT